MLLNNLMLLYLFNVDATERQVCFCYHFTIAAINNNNLSVQY